MHASFTISGLLSSVNLYRSLISISLVCMWEINFVLFNSMLKYVINRLVHAFFHIRTVIRHIATRTNRHLRRHIGTETNRHRTLDKSASTLTNRHFGKNLLYFHVYSTFSKKNSQILVVGSSPIQASCTRYNTVICQ